MLAEATNYAKRNVADECNQLAKAEVLSVTTVGNRFYYSLANPRTLANFVGLAPPISPDWNALLRVVDTINTLARAAETQPREILGIQAHQAARAVRGDLAQLGIDPPPRLRGAEFLDVWNRWASNTMVDLASGRWPAPGTRCT